MDWLYEGLRHDSTYYLVLLRKLRRYGKVPWKAGKRNLHHMGRVQEVSSSKEAFPGLFVVSMNPLTLIHRRCEAGNMLLANKTKINHLLFVDDLKLYPRSESQLESLIQSVRIGSLSDYDDDDNFKKQLVSWAKQQLCTCITLFSTFLWRPLYDYDVKPPNATFCGGRGHATTDFPFSIWTWIKPLRIQL